jgi:hypothetical protein
MAGATRALPAAGTAIIDPAFGGFVVGCEAWLGPCGVTRGRRGREGDARAVSSAPPLSARQPLLARRGARPGGVVDLADVLRVASSHADVSPGSRLT